MNTYLKDFLAGFTAAGCACRFGVGAGAFVGLPEPDIAASIFCAASGEITSPSRINFWSIPAVVAPTFDTYESILAVIWAFIE